MTNESKKLKLDLSSIVSLKAQLLNKQEELRQKKQSVLEIKDVYETNKTQSKWGKKKEVPTQPKTSKDTENKDEDSEEKILEKSKKILESKAKYYEDVISGKKKTEEGDDEIFLVNFYQKVVEETHDDMETEHLNLKQKIDEEEYNKTLKDKWEKESLQNLDKQTIHYQDIRFNEIRNMGVGNYQFSRDENSKTRRILNEIHKLKREKVLVLRLSKVKQKRLLKFGYSLEQIKDLCTEFEKEQEGIEREIKECEKILENPDLLETKNESNDNLDSLEFNKPNIQKPILERDWDKPKLKEKMWTRHVEKLRKERNKLFAPPETYEGSAKKKKKKRKNKNNEAQENFAEKERNQTQTDAFVYNFSFPPPPIPPPGLFFPPFPPFPPTAFPFPPPPSI